MAIPTNRTLNTSKEDHVSDHNAVATLINSVFIRHSIAATSFSVIPSTIGTDLYIEWTVVQSTGTALSIDGGDPSLLVFNEDGIYAINWEVDFETDPNGYRTVLAVPTTADVETSQITAENRVASAGNARPTDVASSLVAWFNAGDFLQIDVTQNSGSPLDQNGVLTAIKLH